MKRYRLPQDEQSLIESLQQPFAVYQFVDRRVVTLALSDGFCRMLGYADREQAVYDMDHNMYKDAHPDDVTRIAGEAVRFATEGGEYNVVYRSRIPGTSGWRMIHAQGRHVTTKTGERLAHIWYMDEGVYQDHPDTAESIVADALKSILHTESILKENRYDTLTGLPGLSYFFELAEAGKAAIRENGGRAVLVYLDLSGMKSYNHRKGFAKGDVLLRSFAKLLTETFSNENCCHISADRFAAFTEEAGLEDLLNAFFRRAEEINGGDTLPVRAGIYSTALGDVPASTAYDYAKVACDTLRKTKASAFCRYSHEIGEKIRRQQYIIENIDRAIAERWIEVYYQPIVRSVSGFVCDEEALARWIDPTEGFLSPADFIPPLEESGQIHKLDLYMLERVLEKIHAQQATGLPIVPHSINLSRADFDMCDIVEEIRRRVDDSGIPRDRIVIEITESIVGNDPDYMREKIRQFRELGFPVWMDDFGSGYSSLDVLQGIPFDLIKFDMSFLRRLDEGENGKIILTELTKMATSMGIGTVCEGVETAEQVQFLQEIGCSKLQGYHFCRPIPYEQILERYRKGIQIGFEDPRTSGYYEAIGRVNLYDLGMIAGEQEDVLQNTFSTLPIGVIELKGNQARFARSSFSYRAFVRKRIGIRISASGTEFAEYDDPFLKNLARICRGQETRAFFDEKRPDGSIVHSFARRIGTNPVTGVTAAAVAVLSVTEPEDGASYAEIARALAADYYDLYTVDLDTGNYREYTSPPGKDELVLKRTGTGFFESVRQEAEIWIHEEDRAMFLSRFTKENIVRELDREGVFTATHRLTDTGKPVYVHLKATWLQGRNRIILGLSNIDSQMKQQAQNAENGNLTS